MLRAPAMKEQRPTVLDSEFKQTQQEELEQNLLRTFNESGHSQLSNVGCD